MTRKLRALTAAAIASLALSSCASINVDDMPQPGKTYSDGYDVVPEFANVLNLPERAKVVMDGTTVGVVESMAVTPSAVDVTARIEHGITIPAGSRMLQQATVLGDIYVARARARADGRCADVGPRRSYSVGADHVAAAVGGHHCQYGGICHQWVHSADPGQHHQGQQRDAAAARRGAGNLVPGIDELAGSRAMSIPSICGSTVSRTPPASSVRTRRS